MPRISGPTPGGEQWAVVEPLPAPLFSAVAVVVADTAYLVKFRVAKPTQATSMTIFVSVAAGTVDLGIYTSTDAATFTLLGSTAPQTAVGAGAVQTLSLAAAVNLVPGVDYWAAVVGSSATLSLLRTSGTAGANLFSKAALAKAAMASSTLATFSTPAANAYQPYFGITTTG